MPFLAILSAFTVVFLWGANFIAIKLGVSEVPPLALLAIRFLIAGLIFLPFLKWPGLRQAGLIASVGFGMGVLHQGTLFLGLEIMPAGVMSILLQSQVIMTALIGLFVFHEKIGWRTWAGITLGFLGIVILIGQPVTGVPLIGYVYGLTSALFIAITYVLMKKVSDVHGPTYIVLLSLPNAPLILLGSLLIEGTDWITLHSSDINWMIAGGSLFYQAVIISLSHIYWQRLLKDYPLSVVIPWTLLIPIFGIAFAIPVFGEQITPSIFIGGVLTIAGVAIITFRKIAKTK